MIVSDRSIYAFLLILLLILAVLFWFLGSPNQHHLLQNLYVALMANYSIWVLATLGMWLTPPNEVELILILDAISCLNVGLPAFYLMIALVFVRGYKRFPKWMLCFLITPVLTPLICLTNNLHHLQYVVFSPIRSQIVFGPFVLVTGVHSYLCYLASLVLLVSFAWRNPSRLYIFQCLLLVLGGLFPLIVSVASTLSPLALPVTAPLLSFLPTLLLNGIAIYRFNLLNITPVATQHILDGISDCYMVVSEQGLVVSYNRPFADIFAAQYGISENHSLRDCLQEEDISQQTALYHMVNALDACRASQTTISYEQAATIPRGNASRKNYYIIDVSPLAIHDRLAGFVLIFKDITQLLKRLNQPRTAATA